MTNPTGAVKVWISRGPAESGQQIYGTVWDKEPKMWGSGTMQSWFFFEQFCPDLKPGEVAQFEVRRVK
jgi:hypothetical protein